MAFSSQLVDFTTQVLVVGALLSVNRFAIPEHDG
jgi:hypothetical protein